ncbi:hypothetical protein V5O48_010859 [Marasmius crinis-equi]|uniref:Membrane insertase YidC/Oxa/ALB C-terminal domain-containing protein n=1 Tax=Marasmius crinis-equi TaxID=585013 RepID=A0ABR3F772_9AGAR
MRGGRILRLNARISCNGTVGFRTKTSNLHLRESLVLPRPLTRSFSLNPWSSKPPQVPDTTPPTPATPLDKLTPAATPPDTVPNTGLPAGVDANPAIDILPQSTLDSAVSTAISNTSDSLAAASTLSSATDLAALGLLTWTPAGLFRWSLELCQSTTGLPWGSTIILGTLLWRVALVPVSIHTMRFASKMARIQPQVEALSSELKQAYATKDVVATTAIVEKQKKIYANAGINPLGGLVGPLIQLPATLGMFFGIRKMCLLPVEQLKDSGIQWVPDLTAADPTGIMPAAFGVAMFWQISVNGQEMAAARPQMAHIMNIMRAGSPVIAWLMADLPSGLLLSLLTTSVFTIFQSHLLRNNSIRSYVGILPPMVGPTGKSREALPSFKSSFQWATESIRERWQQAAIDAREKEMKRRESLNRKKGVGSGGIKRK